MIGHKNLINALQALWRCKVLFMCIFLDAILQSRICATFCKLFDCVRFVINFEFSKKLKL